MNRGSRLIPIAALALATSTLVTSWPARAVASDARITARSDCLASVPRTVGLPASRLTVIRQPSDASGISVDVKVPNAIAPWGCLTDRQGKVEDVHFKGSEGAL